MKKILIALLTVFMMAGFVYAQEEEASIFNFSGMFNSRGTYLSNDSGIEEEAYDYMFYDMEFDATLDITPNDKTAIFLNMEIHDETWDDSPGYAASNADMNNEQNIVFKRAYGKYMFDNGISTEAGLMSGGAFGTAFADSGDGRYRWRVDGMAEFGKWGVILEKTGEVGSTGDDDNDREADDSDNYYGYWVGKFGEITPMVLVGYLVAGETSGVNLEPEGADSNTILLIGAVKGSAGAIGFEGEVVSQSTSIEVDGADPDSVSLFGAYGNVFMGMDAATVGGYVAYGSWDDDAGAGFNFGADFYFGEGVGESQAFGSGAATWVASTLVGVYGDFAASDELSFSGNFSYFMSNEEDTIWEDATGYELTGRGAYQLADNATWSVGIAWGQFDGDDADPDPYTRAFQKIQINF